MDFMILVEKVKEANSLLEYYFILKEAVVAGSVLESPLRSKVENKNNSSALSMNHYLG